MLAEPYFVDDNRRVENVDDLLKYLVLNCETIVCLLDKQVVGVAIFSDFGPRSCMFGGWIAPEFRSRNAEAREAIREFIFEENGILDYAWKELGLTRIEGRTAAVNVSALAFGAEMGFRKVGDLQLDFQFNGELFDSVLFELVNPALVIEPLEEITHGVGRRRIEGTTSGTEQLGVHGTTDGEAGSGDAVTAEHAVFVEPA